MTGAMPTYSTPSLWENVTAYSRWQHTGRGMQIYMHNTAVRMLAEESIRRLKSEPPSEFGGILLGKVQSDGTNGSSVVLVPEIITSPSRLFNTSDADLQNLAQFIRRPAQADLQVIGYFRSHVREGLCLSAQDEMLIRRYFSKPDSIFLIVRPFEVGICMAGFFFWEGGQLQTDTSELEVPFSPMGNSTEDMFPSAENGHGSRQPAQEADTPLRGDPAINARSSQASDPPAPTARRSTASTRSDTFTAPVHLVREPRTATNRKPKRTYSFGWGVLLGLCCLLFAGASFYFVTTRYGASLPLLAGPASDTALGLQVKAGSGGQLDLSWNQSSADIKKAENAKLSIVDGASHRELIIDRDQLRFGRLTYFPNSEDVQFSLEVYVSAARSIAESVRVISPLLNNKDHFLRGDLAGSPADAKASGPAPASMASHSAVHRTAHRTPASETEPTVTVPLSSPEAPSTRNPGPSFIPPNSLLAVHPRNVASALPPPLELFADTFSKPSPGAEFALTKLPSPPKLKEQLVPRVKPVEASSLDTYVPPRPIKQIMPSKALLTASTVFHAVDIPVHIEIDKNGRVSQAQLLHDSSGTDGILSAQAIAAAKQWVFVPAKLHGKNIPSDHTLVFRFRPTE